MRAAWVRLSILLLACSANADLSPEYREMNDEWKARRLASLRGENGFLNLVGLFPLTQTRHQFGFSENDDLRLESTVALPGSPSLGVFERTDSGGYRFVPSGAVPVTHDDAPVTEIAMADDASGPSTILAAGPMRWFVVSRGGELMVRVRNLEAPAIAAFAGFEYYPLDSAYRVTAILEPAESVRELRMDNVIGSYEAFPFVGHLTFAIDGAPQRLTAVESGGRLFLVFGDATNGKGTYPGGRFLYADYPEHGNETTLDFNFAYNPPCSISAHTTCPLPPPGNRLTIPIPVGEKAP